MWDAYSALATSNNSLIVNYLRISMNGDVCVRLLPLYARRRFAKALSMSVNNESMDI
jgi:hypothetical protein